MKKNFFFIALVMFAACKSTSNRHFDKNLSDSQQLVKSSEPYYPITQYIQDQMAYVDSMPLAIEKITFINNRQVDSTTIDRNAFRNLAEEFLHPDLNDKGIKSFYTENAYNDLTTGSIAFNYTTADPGQELRQMDVLLNPQNNRVKNILFRKIKTIGDTTVYLNGLWKHNMHFQLNYTIKPGAGNAQTRQIKVIWDRPL